MDFEKIKALENNMMCLATFSRSIHIFFALYKNLDSLDNYTGNLHPYRTICNALIGDACINWCKVFGSDAEATHWKNVIDDHTHFREVLFSELGITAIEFRSYWNDMLQFRSNIIAHFNSEHFATGFTPGFDTAIASASIAHKYFRESLPENVNYLGPTDLAAYGADAAEEAISKLTV